MELLLFGVGSLLAGLILGSLVGIFGMWVFRNPRQFLYQDERGVFFLLVELTPKYWCDPLLKLLPISFGVIGFLLVLLYFIDGYYNNQWFEHLDLVCAGTYCWP